MSVILTRNGEQSLKLMPFTSAQSAMVKNSYDAFNRNMDRMVEAHGGQFFQGNALTVPKDSWGQWATMGIEVARDELAVFSSLSGVARSVDMGVLVDYFQTISDSSEDVNVSIDGRGKAKTDQPVIDYHGTPLPIFDANCSFGWRQMLTMQRAGGNLQSAAMNNKVRHVSEKLEDMCINGLDLDVGGAKVYGLMNHPQRNTRTTGETLNGATGTEWLAEINATLKLLHNDNFRQSITLYLNWDDYFYASNTDFSTQYPNKSILQRVMEIAGIEAIVPASKIPADTLIGLVRRSSVVEMLNGMPIVNRPKNRLNPEDDYVFQTLAAQAIQLKFDAEGQMGLAVSTGA
jgi:hypothetical protein